MATTKVTITLKIEGTAEDAHYVVGELLDSGLLQDAINTHTFDAGKLLVTSATARTGEQVVKCAICAGGKS
jgi:hypothetical protein